MFWFKLAGTLLLTCGLFFALLVIIEKKNIDFPAKVVYGILAGGCFVAGFVALAIRIGG